MRGSADGDTLHEVTRYLWWSSHEGSTSALDRSFESQKSALLYVCKQNSDSLLRYTRQAGKEWADLFTGRYSITPATPFELASFAHLSCDELASYAEQVCNAFSRHKAKEGVSYRYSPRASASCDVDELLGLLRRNASAHGDVETYLQRQALLLSDIAGFD